MKKSIITLALLFAASSAFAVEPTPGEGKGAGPNFEKRKAEIISRINVRIARNQDELSCVQAAKDHADLKECRKKMKREMKEQHRKNHEKRDGQRP